MRRMFSEKQIERLIQEAIDNQNIKIYEDIDIQSSVDISVLEHSEITIEKGFCSIRKTKENELYLVLNFAMTNTSETSVSVSNSANAQITLPTEIASKIVDISNKSVAEASNAAITACHYYTNAGSSAGFYTTNVAVVNNVNTANKMLIQLRGYGSINAGATHNITLRLFLTL